MGAMIEERLVMQCAAVRSTEYTNKKQEEEVVEEEEQSRAAG